MRITEGSMWLTPDDTPAMVVKFYKGYRNQLTGEYEPAVDLLTMDGQEITLFVADMDDLEWQPAGRFKKIRQARFANGLNYEWECLIEGYKPLRMIQSIRHDDPLMQATPTAKQIARWRKWVTPTPA